MLLACTLLSIKCQYGGSRICRWWCSPNQSRYLSASNANICGNFFPKISNHHSLKTKQLNVSFPIFRQHARLARITKLKPHHLSYIHIVCLLLQLANNNSYYASSTLSRSFLPQSLQYLRKIKIRP